MKILFHFLSGQALPVYIATGFIKPDLNVYLYTPQTQGIIETIRGVIKLNSDSCKVPAFDYKKAHEIITEYIKRYKDHELIMNFTGGTKVQSTAGFVAFREAGRQNLYINSEENKIITFHQDGRTEISENNVTISLDDYCALDGQKIRPFTENEKIPEEFLSLGTFLSENFRMYSNFVLKFASFRSKAGAGNMIYPYIKLNASKTGIVINKQKSMYQVEFVRKGNIVFRTSFYPDTLLDELTGKWFEKKVLKKIRNTGVFDKLYTNVIFDWKDERIKREFEQKNEIDIIGMKGTYPHIFEVKSGGFGKQNIDKLIALKKVFGRYSSLYFITYFQIEGRKKHLNERVKDLGINHITYFGIENFFKSHKLFNPNLF